MSILWLGLASASTDQLPSIEGVSVVVPVGDVDGDGSPDVVVASPEQDTAWLLLGEFTLEDATVFVGQPGDRFGDQVLATGDVDGDGLDDFAIAAPDADTPAPLAGAVHIVTAETESVLLGAEPWDRVGSRLYAAGDVGGDGRADLFVAAPHPTGNGAVGAGWVALVEETEGTIEVGRESGAWFSTTSAGWVHDENGSFFGRSLALTDAGLWIGAPGLGEHGDGGVSDAPGAALLFAFDDPSGVATDQDAVVVVEATAAVGLPWKLLALDGGVLAAAAEASEVFALAPQGATPLWQGTEGALTGWGLVQVDDGVVLSEPGWSDNTGRIVWMDTSSSGSVESAAVATLQGCDVATGQWLSARGDQLGIGSADAVWLYGPDDADALGEACEGGHDLVDSDGDGFFADEDCDDGAGWIHPGADELCGDAEDEDCDGVVDEGCVPLDNGCGSRAWLLLPLMLLWRRGRPALLLLAPGTVLAADHPVDGDPLGTWLGQAEERLSGPVVVRDQTLLLANPSGISDLFAAGEVHELDSPLGTTELLTPLWSGEVEHMRLGSDLAFANEAVLVGADQQGLDGAEPGQMRVYRDGEVVLTLVGKPRDSLGTQVEAGDLDGDGFDEWVVAAPFYGEGGVVALLDPLPVSGTVDLDSLDLIEGEPGAHIGWRMKVVDDLDGDGLDDLVVAADPVSGGKLIVFSAGERVGSWALPDDGAWLGWSLDGRDGRVVVGSPWIERLWVLEGAPDGVVAMPAPVETGPGVGVGVALGPMLLVSDWEGVSIRDPETRAVTGRLVGPPSLGEGLFWLPDQNGDGVEDAVVFAPDASVTAERQGAAWLLSGEALVQGTLPVLEVDDDTGFVVPEPDGCAHARPRAIGLLSLLGLLLLQRRS